LHYLLQVLSSVAIVGLHILLFSPRDLCRAKPRLQSRSAYSKVCTSVFVRCLLSRQNNKENRQTVDRTISCNKVGEGSNFDKALTLIPSGLLSFLSAAFNVTSQ